MEHTYPSQVAQSPTRADRLYKSTRTLSQLSVQIANNCNKFQSHHRMLSFLARSPSVAHLHNLSLSRHSLYYMKI